MESTTAQTVDADQQLRESVGSFYLRHEAYGPKKIDWVQIACGISYAGFFSTGVIIAAACYTQAAAPGWDWSLVSLVSGVVSLLALGGVGFLFTGALAIGSLYAISFSCDTLDIKPDAVWIGGVAGGLVGLLASVPLMSWGEPSNSLAAATVAMIALLQFGGAYGGHHSAALRRQIARARLAAAQAPNDEEAQPAQPWQFGLRQLFWLTVLFSVLMALLESFDVLRGKSGEVLGVWLAIAVVLTPLSVTLAKGLVALKSRRMIRQSLAKRTASST